MFASFVAWLCLTSCLVYQHFCTDSNVFALCSAFSFFTLLVEIVLYVTAIFVKKNNHYNPFSDLCKQLKI